MRIRIELDCSNSAFDEHPLREIQRILGTVPKKLIKQLSRPASLCKHPEDADVLHDINGNKVGTIELIEEGA